MKSIKYDERRLETLSVIFKTIGSLITFEANGNIETHFKELKVANDPDDETNKILVDSRGLYVIRVDGSCRRFIHKKDHMDEVIRPSEFKEGHSYICKSLICGSNYRSTYYHKLVARCYMWDDELKLLNQGHKFKEIYVNHKDLNKNNNKPDNLEYCLKYQNDKHSRLIKAIIKNGGFNNQFKNVIYVNNQVASTLIQGISIYWIEEFEREKYSLNDPKTHQINALIEWLIAKGYWWDTSKPWPTTKSEAMCYNKYYKNHPYKLDEFI